MCNNLPWTIILKSSLTKNFIGGQYYNAKILRSIRIFRHALRSLFVFYQNLMKFNFTPIQICQLLEFVNLIERFYLLPRGSWKSITNLDREMPKRIHESLKICACTVVKRKVPRKFLFKDLKGFLQILLDLSNWNTLYMLSFLKKT